MYEYKVGKLGMGSCFVLKQCKVFVSTNIKIKAYLQNNKKINEKRQILELHALEDASASSCFPASCVSEQKQIKVSINYVQTKNNQNKFLQYNASRIV